MSIILETRHISVDFFGLKALDDFSIQLHDQEILAIIGPNGAGKTTAFNVLTGIYQASQGDYLYLGKRVDHPTSHNLAQKGIARTFQNIRLFKELSVLENIKAALNQEMNYSWISGAFRLKNYWLQEKQATQEAISLLSIFNLQDSKDLPAKNLPYGAQRKLEILRCLAIKPKVLLLDEPAAGMNPQETLDLMTTIAKIRQDFNLSIILIEHDMKLVLGISDRLLVLDQGKILAQGKPTEVLQDPRVISAYLGENL